MSEIGPEIGHGASEEHKRIGLLISILALMLSVTEILGTAANTAALQHNVEASNLWGFFQAKHIRETALNVAADEMETDAAGNHDAAQKKLMDERIELWRSTAKRLNDDPSSNEGRKQLSGRAKDAEKERDGSERKAHRYELAKGAFQIGIVLAGASIITGLTYLVRLASGLSVVGLLLLLAGLLV